jgi:hypothetical protein
MKVMVSWISRVKEAIVWTVLCSILNMRHGCTHTLKLGGCTNGYTPVADDKGRWRANKL